MAVVWTDTPLIKKITLPTGTSYFLADREGREKIEQLFETIAGGVSFNIAWSATDYASTSAPTASKLSGVPAGVVVKYNNGASTATGTLDPDDAAPGAFYLVYSDTQTAGGSGDKFDEYVPVGEAGSKSWEKIGDTQIDLSDIVTAVTLSKQTTNVVTGYNSPTSKSVLGSSTTFSITNSAVTFGTPTTDTFVKSVTAETGKNLVTTSITPTNGTDSATLITNKVDGKLVTSSITPAGTATAVISSVTDVTSKLAVSNIYGVQSGTTTASFATADTTQSTISGFTATTSATYDPTKDILQGTSVQDEVLTIGAVSYASQSTTQFTFSNVTVPIKNTASTTFATGALTATGTGADVMTGTSTSTKNVATVGTAVTLATGGVSSNGSGSAVVQSFTTSDKTLAKAGTAVTVATGATSTTGTGDAVVTGVTVGSSAAAITALPTATIGTGITVGTNDTVTALTGLGTATTASVLTNATDVNVTKGQ